jgi:hypothetical protein
MTFKDDIAGDLSVFFNNTEWAYDATYRVGGLGVGVLVQVIPTDRFAHVVIERSGSTNDRQSNLSARLDQVTAPKRGDTFTIAAGDYAGVLVVRQVGARAMGVVELDCTIQSLAELGAKTMREVR